MENVCYERIESPPTTPPANLDPDNEDSWTKWPTSSSPEIFLEKLQNGLENNDFSNVKVEGSIAVTQIVRAARHSPNELLKEAFGFSVMARNADLVVDLVERIDGAQTDISGLYPFHLATSYLGGSKTCCNVFETLVVGLFGENFIRRVYINDLGHTVLDNLMISILKAHTSCAPQVVDHVFRGEKRFAGEEVDICGRWDADSDCVRALLANGNPAIPFEWKHMFCHTSVQTICHCIESIFGPPWRPDIDTPSGLFVERCQCGIKLQLLPLHTLIVTAFHLAQRGCKGETLFGILACLLCLLGHGANPLLKAHVSGQALLTGNQANDCDHEELDPLELTEKIPVSFASTWSSEVIVGWEIIRHVLRHSQAEWSPHHSQRRSGLGEDEHNDEYGEFIRHDDDETNIDEESSINEEFTTDQHLPTECAGGYYHMKFFGESKVLAALWAAVQTEILTYRRLEIGDSWISSNFNMHDLLAGLNAGRGINIGLVQKKMMKSFCECGRFFEAYDDHCVGVDEASAHYFSNLEDWSRSTYIETPENRMENWYKALAID